MRAKFINEKFSVDSDPIKDMGIGVEQVNFDEMRIEKIKEKTNLSLSAWLRYLESLKGVTISGNFKIDDYYNHKKRKHKKFEIMRIESYNAGESLTIYDTHGNDYIIIEKEKYLLFR